MTSYAHAAFTAATTKQFRAGLLSAIRADFILDAAEVAADPYSNMRDGVVRHGVFVNGRHIGYAAVLNAAGDLEVTELQVIGRRAPKAIKSIAELRAMAEDKRTFSAFGI